MVKNPPANAGDTGLMSGLERSSGEGNSNPFQYSCLENSMYGELVGYSPQGGKESDRDEHAGTPSIQALNC